MARRFTSAEVELIAKDKTGPGVESAKGKIGGLTNFVKSYGAELAAVGASVFGLVKMGKKLVDAYSQQEDALVNLESAMKTSGTYTDESYKALQEYATEIQKATTTGDEAALALMALGTSMGLSTDEIRTATEYAIGLAEVYNIDLNTAMRGVALAMEGQYTMLNRYIPQLREAQTEEEKQEAFVRASTAAYQIAQDQTKTYAGMVEQLKNQFGDIAEKLGELLIPMLSKLLEWVKMGVDWFNNLNPTVQKIVTVMMLLGGAAILLAPAIMAIITMAPALGAAITLATGPLGPILLGVMALTVGIIMLIKHWEEVKAFFVNLWNALKEFWDKIEPFVAAFVPLYGIPKMIIENWESIIGFFKKIGDALQAFVDRFFGIVDRIREGVEKIGGAFKGLFDRLVGHSIVPELVTGIESEFNRLIDYMKNDFQQSFVGTMDVVWSSTKSIAEGIKDTIKNLLADMIRAIAKQYAEIAAAFLITLQFGKALRYFAASAALYAAAGAIRKMQKGGEFVTNGPELLLVGDNPSGREHVKVTPSEQPEYQGGSAGPMQGDVYFDGTKVGRWIAKQVRAKNIPIYKGALVSS